MPGPLVDSILLFAQAKAAAPAAGDGGGNILNLLIPIFAIVLLFQVMFGGPQRKQEARRKALLAAMKKNDRVMTTSGIFGTIVALDPDSDRVTLRVDDDKGVKIEFSKAAITQVLNADKDKESEKPAAVGGK
jgi:preprotein translocase subunit YajC